GGGEARRGESGPERREDHPEQAADESGERGSARLRASLLGLHAAILTPRDTRRPAPFRPDRVMPGRPARRERIVEQRRPRPHTRRPRCPTATGRTSSSSGETTSASRTSAATGTG